MTRGGSISQTREWQVRVVNALMGWVENFVAPQRNPTQRFLQLQIITAPTCCADASFLFKANRMTHYRICKRRQQFQPDSKEAHLFLSHAYTQLNRDAEAAQERAKAQALR